MEDLGNTQDQQSILASAADTAISSVENIPSQVASLGASAVSSVENAAESAGSAVLSGAETLGSGLLSGLKVIAIIAVAAGVIYLVLTYRQSKGKAF